MNYGLRLMAFSFHYNIKYAILIIAISLFSCPIYTRAECGYHNVTGYVWSRNTGWISLNCKTGGIIDYGLDIDFEAEGNTVDVTGYAWSSNLGWLNFDPAGAYPAYGSAQFDATFFREIGDSATTTAGSIQGWAKWPILGDNGWMVLGPIEIAGTDYGVEIGLDRLFSGWSWNGGDNIDADDQLERGDGWVMWDSVESGGGASVLKYWFETLYGDIYSGGSINEPFAPPIDRYNATYLIQSNGTIHPVTITSQGGTEIPYISESHDLFELPDQENKYRGTLGWIDKAGLLSGRYGEVKSSLPSGSSVLLDGGVYHYASDLTISSALTFIKGTGDQKGSGTIIVDGDLRIDADMNYESGAIGGRVENLPSVAWIVLGNVIIDKDVQNAVGLFYSEGAIKTGTSGSSVNDIPIIIEGMLIANQIDLERLFVDQNNEPAEKIIFDGRAIINPPPGLSDISKGLPVLTESRPE